MDPKSPNADPMFAARMATLEAMIAEETWKIMEGFYGPQGQPQGIIYFSLAND